MVPTIVNFHANGFVVSAILGISCFNILA